MATDLLAFKQRVQLRMKKKLGDHKDDLFKVCRPITEIKAIVEVSDLDGGNNFTAQNGATAPSASSIRAVKSQSNPIRYEIDVPVTDEQMLDWERAADDTGDLLMQRAWQKITVLFWTLIAGARAVAHPEDGVSGSPLTAVGGGTMYVIDNRTTAPINGGSSFDMTNDFTLACTVTNIRTLLDYRPNFRDRDGGSTAPPAKAYLWCVNELAALARNLCQQAGLMFNGSGLQEGFKGVIEDVIAIPREASAATDLWGIIWVSESTDENGVSSMDGPALLHFRAAPTVKVDPHPGGGFSHCYCSFSAGVFFHPTCHRDFVLSKP